MLGNQRHVEALPALVKGLADDEQLVRGACAWALGQYDTPATRTALEHRAKIEVDKDVIEEITVALR